MTRLKLEGAASGLGRRERRKRATRQALLEAALTLIGERGVYDTRVEDVTDRADVAKGVFYNYFDSKAALVAALVIDSARMMEEEYLVGVPVGTLAQRLEAAVVAHERFFRAWPARAILFHQARGLLELSHTSVPELRDAFTDYLLRLGAFLFPGQAPNTRGHLDLTTAVAGAISGYRSYGKAAGLSPRAGLMAELLVSGVPGLKRKARESSRPKRALSTASRR